MKKMEEKEKDKLLKMLQLINSWHSLAVAMALDSPRKRLFPAEIIAEAEPLAGRRIRPAAISLDLKAMVDSGIVEQFCCAGRRNLYAAKKEFADFVFAIKNWKEERNDSSSDSAA